jgi:hypothetical protein
MVIYSRSEPAGGVAGRQDEWQQQELEDKTSAAVGLSQPKRSFIEVLVLAASFLFSFFLRGEDVQCRCMKTSSTQV